MIPVNDEHTPESELVQLTGQCRFILSAIAHYADDPSEARWWIVTETRNALREMTDSIWERYMVRNGELTEPENTTVSSV